jgi:hypothetical protein
MEQSASWEANISLAIQEISCIFLEPKGFLPCSQEPVICLYPEPD